jgi:hypothetical protein
MTTRNTLAQRNSNSNAKVPATLVEGRKAVVVRIDWTDAPVIKTTVRKNFRMSVLAMDTRTWMPLQRSMMSLTAGQVIHYTQSASHPGYYYITIVGESCTCVAGLYKQECHHQTDAVAFETTRTDGVSRKWQAGAERHFENLCSAA